MPNTSPYDMIHKARRYAATADRWAVLKANTHDRTPLNSPPQQAAPIQAAPFHGNPAQPAPQQPPADSGYQQLAQPPFPPPQPRHPYMDEIAQRHEQAWKSATPLQAWTPEPSPPGTWRDPVQAQRAGEQTASKAPGDRPAPAKQPTVPPALPESGAEA